MFLLSKVSVNNEVIRFTNMNTKYPNYKELRKVSITTIYLCSFVNVVFPRQNALCELLLFFKMCIIIDELILFLTCGCT